MLKRCAGGRGTLFVAAAALPLLLGAAASAATPDAPAATASAGSAPGAGAGTGAVSEIVVTATRQEQRISKVAESVTAFTAKQLEQLDVKTFADIVKYTPGVTYDEDSHNIYIRGIESTAGSGTTGIYIDDTPIQMRELGFNANNTLPEVFDLERVEVLRGPQGTLFGAGSEGGTVRYITTQPSLTSYSADAHGEVADTRYGAPSYEAGAAVGGPIVEDKIGFRVSVWARHDGGWVDRDNSGDVGGYEADANYVDTYVLRGAVTFAPVSNFTATATVNFEERDQHNHDEYWVGISDPNAGQYLSGTPELMGDADHFVLPSLRMEWDAGPAVLISNTSYYDRKEVTNGYSGSLYDLSYFEHFTEASPPTDPQGNYPEGCPSPTPTVSMPGCVLGPLLTPTGLDTHGFGRYEAVNFITNSQDNITQELRIQSPTADARLNWTAGLFYAYDAQRSVEEIRDPQLPALTEYLWGESMLTAWGMNLLPNGDDYINDTGAHDRQIALYGDASYKVTEQLKLEVGLRYAWTHFDYFNFNNGAQDLLDDGGVAATASGGENETPFTPKASLTYQFTPSDMAYFTYAKGYRIGGATPPLPIPACGPTPFPTQYNSDTVDSYEIGSKDSFLDRTLYVSGSVFYVRWNNIQQAIYVPLCGIQYTTNVGQAVSQGFDLEGEWRPIHAFEFDFDAGYTDAYFTQDVNSVGGLIAAKGDVLDVPPWTASLAAQYNYAVAGHDGFLRLEYELTTKRTKPIPEEDPLAAAVYDPGLRPDPTTNYLSLRAGMTFGQANVILYAENLFDAHPELDLQHQDAQTLLYEATTFRPLTVGLSVDYKWR